MCSYVVIFLCDTNKLLHVHRSLQRLVMVHQTSLTHTVYMEVPWELKKWRQQGQILDGLTSPSTFLRMLKSKQFYDQLISYCVIVSQRLNFTYCSMIPFARHWSRHTPEGAALEAEWDTKWAAYEKKYKDEAAELKSIIKGDFPAGWEKALPVSP